MHGLGIPDEHAREYERVVTRGGTFVSVRAASESQTTELQRLLAQYGARVVNSYAAQL